MKLIVAVAIVFLILVGSELYWRSRKVHHQEFSRKFVHITVGCFIAFWPFFLSWDHIRLLSLSFLIVIALSKYWGIFRAIHSVQRPTWGEVFFALSVGAVTFVTNNKWIYAAALLQMSLADGLAAVVGTRYGNRRRYSVFGHPKTIVGSLTFFVVSVVILGLYSHYGTTTITLAWPSVATLAVAATAIENVGVAGFDNLLVPLLMAVSLRLLA